MKTFTCAVLGIALFLSGAKADTMLFTTSFLTDGKQPASATALFTFITNGQLTVTLTDTTKNPVSDAPNLAETAFTIGGLNSGSVASASGQTITHVQKNTGGTTGAYLGTSPWGLTWGNYWGNNNAFDLYATGANAANHNTAPYSIVGAPSSNGTYTEVFPTGVTQGSANLLSSGNDGVMFFQSATFTLSIPHLTASNFASLSNVVFGFGPDSQNKPDADDVSKGILVSYSNRPVPEPSSMSLIGLGLCGIALIGRKFTRKETRIVAAISHLATAPAALHRLRWPVHHHSRHRNVAR